MDSSWSNTIKNNQNQGTFIHIEEVVGSSPITSTRIKRPMTGCFFRAWCWTRTNWFGTKRAWPRSERDPPKSPRTKWLDWFWQGIIQSNHIHQNKTPYDGAFFAVIYLNPFSRQHADAAVFQSEYCFDGVRRSRHGCHPLHFLFAPVPVHLTYLRSEQVWLETLPVSVVHFTTTFWLRASFLPNSLDDNTWYADAQCTADAATKTTNNIFFMSVPLLSLFIL